MIEFELISNHIEYVCVYIHAAYLWHILYFNNLAIVFRKIGSQKHPSEDTSYKMDV